MKTSPNKWKNARVGRKTHNKQTIILRSFTEKVNEPIIHEILKPKFIRVTFAFDFQVAYMGIRLTKGFCRKVCVIISFFIVISIKKIFWFFSRTIGTWHKISFVNWIQVLLKKEYCSYIYNKLEFNMYGSEIHRFVEMTILYSIGSLGYYGTLLWD